MKEFNFSGKTVVITGGGTGIGFVMAKSFCQLGANVVICGRRQSKLDEANDMLIKAGDVITDKFFTFVCDMSVEEEVSKMLNAVIARFNSVDVFVNNSGVWALIPLSEMKSSDIDYAYNNTIKSTIIGTKAAAEVMSDKGGSIINIGSFAGLLAQKDASLYACFKTAIISFTKSAAVELAEKNIRVNCVTPGVIRTPMTDEYIDNNYERLIKPIAQKRVGTAEEVADGVIYLASDYSSYVTGENLCITGGKYLTQI